jgi:hypothetical protein
MNMEQPVDPEAFFRLVTAHLPPELQPHILVVGSLAAAYHHRAELQRRGLQGVRTKDVDLIIHPAGAVAECRRIAAQLLEEGWRHTAQCWPSHQPDPSDALRAIRLYPPTSNAYFIELLALPEQGQQELKRWIPVELNDGWYGLPSFRFMGLTSHDARRSEHGIRYACPSMMALSNLLSHRELGTTLISQPIGGRALLRSAKDLGRVLALAYLAGRAETETWPERWEEALRHHFPKEYREIAARAGQGLRELLEDHAAMEQALHAVGINLLSGLGLTIDHLDATARRLMVDAIEPLAARCRR